MQNYRKMIKKHYNKIKDLTKFKNYVNIKLKVWKHINIRIVKN